MLNLKYSLPEGIVVGVGLPLTGSDNKSYDAYVLLKKSKIIGVSVLHSCYNSCDSRVRFFRTPCVEGLSFNIGSESFTPANTFEVELKVSSNLVETRRVGVYFNEGDLSYLDKVELLICPEAKRFELFDDKSVL